MEHDSSKPARRSGGLMSPRELAGIVLETVVYRFFAIKAAAPLLLGAAMLSSAIGYWKNADQSQSLSSRLTEAATGTVQAAWWRLDFAVDKMADASNWMAFVSPQFCAQVQHASDAGQDQTTTACASFGKILDFTQGPYQLATINSPAGSRALPWRDAQGQPGVGLKFSPEAWRFLTETTTPYAFDYRWWSPVDGTGEAGDMSYWQAFVKEFDNPPHYLRTLWQFAPQTPVRRDPQNPGAAIPATFLSDSGYEDLGIVAPVLGVAGALFWVMGLRFFLLESRRRTWLTAAVVSLALAPWWGNWVYRGLDHLMPEATDIAGFLENLFLSGPSRIDVLTATQPHVATDTGFHWSLKTSHYAPLYQGIELPPPDRALTEEEATVRLETLIGQSLAGRAVDEQRRRLELLTCYAKNDFRTGGYPFLPWARDLTEHPELGTLARQFVEFQEGGGVYFYGPDCEPA